MHHPLIDIPELVRLDEGQGMGIVRIPNEQDVPFTRRVRALVDTAVSAMAPGSNRRLRYPAASNFGSLLPQEQ